MSDRIDFGGEPWQAIPRRILRDARLSYRARGGLCTLLSHEEGWVRSAIAVLMHEGNCGRKQAQAIMAELRLHGYAELVTDATGLSKQGHPNLRKTHYVIYAIPQGGTFQPSLVNSSDLPVSDPLENWSTSPRAAVVEALDVDPLDVEPQDITLERERVARARNPLFDALAEATGYDPTAMTTREARACGVALAEIKAATPDLTIEELQRRASNYLTHFDGAALTPNALANQWSKCREPLPRRRMGRRPSVIEEWMAEQDVVDG